MRATVAFVLSLLSGLAALACEESLLAASPVPAAQRDWARYFEALDRTLENKLTLIEGALQARPGGRYLDVGMGTGAVVAALATRHPQAQFWGVDAFSGALREARKNHGSVPNLRMALGDARELPFPAQFDGVVLSSVLHELFSYSGDSALVLENGLREVARVLTPGGRVVIRDFVRPAEGGKKVVLEHHFLDQRAGQRFADFARGFGRRVPHKELPPTQDYQRIETDLASAYDFIYRKDFRYNWQPELRERFGFWSEAEARAMLAAAGFRLVRLELLSNPWIVANRLRGNVRLRDADTGEELPFPAYQMLIVAEKI